MLGSRGTTAMRCACPSSTVGSTQPAGTKVTGPDGTVVKAATLSGASNLLLRRNSVSGAVEVVPNKGSGVELNAALHAND